MYKELKITFPFRLLQCPQHISGQFWRRYCAYTHREGGGGVDGGSEGGIEGEGERGRKREERERERERGRKRERKRER